MKDHPIKNRNILYIDLILLILDDFDRSYDLQTFNEFGGMYFLFPLDVAPDDILLPGHLLSIRISHILKISYSFPFYHFYNVLYFIK